MEDVIQYIIDNQSIVAGIAVMLALVTLYYFLRWFLGRNMRRMVYICLDHFIRNCHEQSFYSPSHNEYTEYLPLYKKLNARKKFLFYNQSSRTFLQNFLTWFDMADSFIGRVASYMSSDHYFAHSEYQSCLTDIDFEKTACPFLTYEFLTYVNKVVPESLTNIDKYKHELERGFSDIPQTHNVIFVKEELERHKAYFDTVLSYPLDQQQRESIVKLEDNCLVISSAGSGKTSTSVGKIKYLVEKRNVEPAKILPLTYTTKAASELSQRLALSQRGLSCHTFHSLAFRILAETTKEVPSICENNLMLQCFYHLIDTNPDFKIAINSFLTEKSSLTKNEHEYLTPDAYAKDRALYGIQAPFLDMDGRIIFTRSEEEKKICTFLSMNNVSFRYEEPFPYDTATEFKRQYRPDFTIHFDYLGRSYYLILEHFGIDANGNVPSWFGVGQEGGYSGANQRYNEGIVWKRNINRRYNIALLETTSAMFHDGSIYQNLTEQLRRYHINMRPLTEDEKFERLVKRNKKMEDSLLQLISTFIALMKSNRSTPESILETIKKEQSKRPDFIERSRFMLYEIFMPMYNEYQKTLAEKKQIDYTDLILKATDICEAGLYKKEYDMILVDEFQDISVDRFRLLQSLRRKQPLTKLYCVGDDWQSIFRFSGSDLSLFNSFEDYFGYTEKCKIEKTYRFGEPLIKLSSDFILQNQFQVPKEVQSSDSSRQTVLTLVECQSDEGAQFEHVKSIINGINQQESIMLVGRYHSDADFIPSNCIVERDQKYNVTKVRIAGREMSYNTIHSAKGLEADNIILVNCSQDGNGFPSTVSDDPILGYVLSKPEAFPFAEERRLFYVAITRAKKHAYVLYKDTCPSPFITDIRKAIDGKSPSKDTMTCPWCRNGNLRSISEGTNINGTNWRVYRCTNYTAGCQYSWVVSFNDEESITRQFKEMNRKSRLYISANDLERLRLENPNADCGVTAAFAPMPPSPPPPPEPRIRNDIDSLDDLPF
jgi:DNA helicase-4